MRTVSRPFQLAAVVVVLAVTPPPVAASATLELIWKSFGGPRQVIGVGEKRVLTEEVEGRLVVRDLRDGRILRATNLPGGRCPNRVVLSGDLLFYGNGRHHIFAINWKDCVTLWSRRLVDPSLPRSQSQTLPVPWRPIVLCGPPDHGAPLCVAVGSVLCAALDRHTGSTLWVHPGTGLVYPPLSIRSSIILADRAGHLVSLNTDFRVV